eukprot:CAMPEP_0170581410 /NCGR_PEP_ID=MMETSP0224-20130122/7021_1 /TAXON_ID=285029 /ORGANISM="Togula jolla, Strain CCCM 725" /LENGTH=68 /DNA_ID=CAMNT_0010904537 /DNA_START=656 /DNA_END=862 /DNA_ORIENTATION=-
MGNESASLHHSPSSSLRPSATSAGLSSDCDATKSSQGVGELVVIRAEATSPWGALPEDPGAATPSSFL